jgi:hypothetical protein
VSLAAQAGLLGFSLCLRPTTHRGPQDAREPRALTIGRRDLESWDTLRSRALPVGPVPRDTWWRVVACSAVCLDLKLVRSVQGTDSCPHAHLGGGSKLTGGANIFFPHATFLKFHLGGWSGSVPLLVDTRQCLVDAQCRSAPRGR